MTHRKSNDSSKQQTIRLTIADTRSSPVSKKITVVDGKLHKNPSSTPSSYSFKVVECSGAREFNDLLNGLTTTQFIITGLPHEKGQSDKLLNQGSIVSKEDFETSSRELPRSTITRTLDCFTDGDFFLIDIDDAQLKFNNISSKIVELAPELNGVPMLIRASSSYGLSVLGQKPESSHTNAHAYIFCKSSHNQLARVGEILSKQCWLKGIENKISISRCGTMLVRQLIDKAVFSPERIIYESSPILGENVIQNDIQPTIIIDGGDGFFDLSKIPDLTTQQQFQYEKLIREEKRKHQNEANDVSYNDIEKKIRQAISAGIDPQKARRDIIASKRDNTLYGSQMIRLDLYGWVKIDDLLDDPLKYDGETASDPMEPDYNGGKNIAKFYANLDKTTGEINPIIFTQAHGGRSFRIQREPFISETSDEIIYNLSQTLQIDVDTLKQSGLILESVVEKILASSFFNPSLNKFGFINDQGDYVVFSETDAKKALTRCFGQLVNKNILDDFVTEYLNSGTASLTNGNKPSIRVAIEKIPINTLIEKIKYSNQRKQIEATVDMFTSEPKLLLLPDKVKLIFPYKQPQFEPRKVSELIKTEIISDYKQHFDLFDELIDFVVAARFAPDRKNAFLWIHAVSDNGKNFLIDAFKKLGLVAELSVKELEKMFDGHPVGRRMTDFIHAFMLVFDEVKTVKGEIKQINNRALLSPKFESMCEVDLYAKLFLSAETIPALAGEQGAEQQFVNRFNKFRLTNNLKDREVFKHFGSGLYHAVVTGYLLDEINKRVDHYIALGSDQASKAAHDYLAEFHARHNLGHYIHSLDETVHDFASEISTLVRSYIAQHKNKEYELVEFNYEAYCDYALFTKLKNLLVISDETDGKVVLKTPGKFVEDFIAGRASQSSRGSLSYKTDQIVEEMGERGVYSVKVGGKTRTVRGLLIDDSYQH